MSHRTLRCRGAVLCAVSSVMLLLLLLAGPAAAAQSFDVANRATIELDRDAHWWQQNTASREQNATYGGYQYTSEWDAADGSGNVYLKIIRRKLSDNSLEERTFNETNGRLIDILDPHNDTLLGVSPRDGTLHVIWTEHNDPLHYGVSEARCLTQARFSSCRFEWPNTQVGTFERGRTTRGAYEESVTYPMFINDVGGGLYCLFRAGSGASGYIVLHDYSTEAGRRWTDLGPIASGASGTGTYDVDNEGPLPAASTRGPYIDSAQFDHNDRLHLTWTWRENVRTHPFLQQHDIYYAFSDNYGRDWYDNSGSEVIATATSDPITIRDTGTVAVSIPYGWMRPNIMRMVIDRDNQPHLMMPTSDVNTTDLMAVNVRQAHFWRTTDGAWHESFIEGAEVGNQEFPAGSLMFDRANNAYYVYTKNRLDWLAASNDAVNPTYNIEFPSDHLVWDGRETVLAEPVSEITAMDTINNVNLPISFSSSTANRNIEIRIRNDTDATDGHFNFLTAEDQRWGAEKEVAFTDSNDGSWHTYTISLERVRTWTGTLMTLELLPAASARPRSGRITIDYIRIQNDRRTIGKQWEFNQGPQLYVAEASTTNNWERWEIYEIARGANLSWYDAIANSIDLRRYDAERVVNFPVLEQGAFGTEIFKTYEYRITGDGVAKYWGFGSDTIGWTAAALVSELRWASDGGVGSIEGRITGNDSAIDSPTNVGTPLGGRTVEISMKQTAGTTAMVCWTTTTSRTWNINRCSRTFEVRVNGRYNVYRISTSGWREWESRNTLYQLRIEPSDSREVTSGTFYVEHVEIID